MRKRATPLAAFALLLLTVAGAAPPEQRPYDTVIAQAEKEYAEKSFSRARALYEQASKLKLEPAEARWVRFRLADTAWRADAAAPDDDATARNNARKELEELANLEPADRVAAEARESLGDLLTTHSHIRDPHSALREYLRALDYWAGSDEIELARTRYLSIIRRLAEHAEWLPIPTTYLSDAILVARTPGERALTRFLLARQLLRENRPEGAERAFELLGEVLREGRTPWYDDALHHYATALVRWSDMAAASDSDDLPEPDYEEALALFRRLLSEFAPGETRYRDDAQRAIDELTRVSIDVTATGTFLPDSDQEIALAWRNASAIELALHSVDLTKDVLPVDRHRDWKQQIAFEGRPLVRRWTHETHTPAHYRGQHLLRIEPRLPMGAYVLVARANGQMARELVLVTDAHILLHDAAGQSKIFVSDVETGEPIANARVQLVHYSPTLKRGPSLQTGANGLAEAAFREPNGSMALVTAAAGARQAYHTIYIQPRHREERPQWRVYAFTDRPAYRPNETVKWKIIARTRGDDERWTTPSGSLHYTIRGPRGEEVAKGVAKLSAFGTFAGELSLTPSMPLGQYHIDFAGAPGSGEFGSAVLFRLEEYKLPEFLVTVNTPEGRQYRLGDTIEATIEASYYFGGPVANAEVEAVVYQGPLHRWWFPWRTYHWYWPEPHRMPHQQVRTERLRTDAGGRAVLRIETPRDGTDSEYRIEARVVDASRREVRGEGTVRVTKQRYTVMAQPEHYLHRPNDPVSIEFKAMDANDRPVQTTGTVTVVRRQWRERAYADDEVLATKLTTDAQGEATLTFTPRQTGYYAIRWTSVDGDPKRMRDRVTAETTIWVAERTTTDVGYYHAGGVDVIVDREAVRAGEQATALVVTPSAGRWVLFSSAAGDLVETQVLRMEGTAKLVQLAVDERHVPNFFLVASSVFARNVATDSERVVVPPDEQFLTVDVKADREEYEPRQEGTLTVTTRDRAGKPVPAEVALGVSDEAVTAIARDPAGDPRQFFFGEQRYQSVQVSAALHSQRYVKLDEEEERARREKMQAQHGRAGGYIGRGAREEVAEAITVTASAPQNFAYDRSAPPPPPPPPSVAPAPPAGGAATDAIDVVVRSDFRSTAFWQPDLVTDAGGTATVRFRFPEALTTWRATARAVTAATQVGMASATARTNLPLLVRLQAPRFFVAGDRSTVSAVINNNTAEAMTVTPLLEVEGLTFGGETLPALTVPANGEVRADWTVLAERAGPAKLRVTARGARHGDAMEKEFTVFEHGIDKLIAQSGKLRGDEALVRLELPRERRATDLTVQVAPSLATAMLDALPYLLDFPYGCTEQTMSRFLPAVVVARTLRSLGLDPEERLSQKRLDEVTRAGIARLYDMQHENGSWGWWKESGDDPFMTAYVLWGFAIAREARLDVDAGRIDRAARWLETQLAEAVDVNEKAWILHALSAWRGGRPSRAEQVAFDDVWQKRERLSAYARALFALTAHRYGEAERARVLIRNLEDGVKLDTSGGAAESMATAHWGASNRFWWRWHEGPVETTAFALQALVTVDPQHRLIEPAMNWLVKNRRGARWSNTRDTAISLLALNDYLKQSGELRGDVAYEVTVNGRVVATRTVTAADVLRAPSRFSVDPQFLSERTQEIRIRRTGGKGPLYFAAEARFVSLEEPVTAAGNEMFVRRDYYRLAARPTLLRGDVYDKVPLRDGDSIRSGERIEVVATVEVKNDYEYLVFEDLKPAGFEAVELQSGQPLYATSRSGGRSTFVYQELRDRHVALFIDRLPQGTHEIRYTLRAETPGSFHALPLLGAAMYVPEIRANGEEVRVTVMER